MFFYSINKLTICLFFIGLAGKSLSQIPQDFKSNVVSFGSLNHFRHPEQAGYGFIVGDSSDHQYFVVIDTKEKNRDQPDRMKVRCPGGQIADAERLCKACNIEIKGRSKYYMALYQIKSLTFPKKSFIQNLSHEPAGTTYYATWDYAPHKYHLFNGKDDHDFALRDSDYRKISFWRKISNLVYKIKKKDKHGQSGMPVVDDQQNLVGLIAENEGSTKDEHTLRMLNIVSIQNEIRKFSRNYSQTQRDSDCRFFNLIEYNHTEPACSPPILSDLSTLAAFKAQEVLHDKNYKYTATIGGTMNYFAPVYSESSSIGYGLGANLHINTDKNHLQFTIGGKYQFAGFEPRPGQILTPNVTQLRSRTLQVPLLAEYTLNTKDEADFFFGFGYNPGIPLSLYYQTGAISLNQIFIPGTTINITDNAAITHKIAIEWGVETHKLRFNVLVNYQINSFVKNDDGIFNPDGSTSGTFYNGVGKHMVFAEIGLSYRLWGYWKNGVNLR